MRKLVKTLTVGTTVATLLSAPTFADGTENGARQSVYLNDQAFTGDAFSSNLNVVVRQTETATGSAASFGNAANAFADYGNMALHSNQALQSQGSATATLSVERAQQAAVSAATYGNGVTAATADGYNYVESMQSARQGSSVAATASATGGVYDQLGVAATGVVNALEATSVNGSVSGFAGQRSYGSANAVATVAADAVCCDSSAAAVAMQNAVTADSQSGGQSLAVYQGAYEGSTTANTSVAAGYVQDFNANATAVANSTTTATNGRTSTLEAVQELAGTVSAVTTIDAGGFGANVAGGATAMGNSALSTAIGEDNTVTLDQTIFEGGGVSARADVSAGDGSIDPMGFGGATATAIGNAGSAYACSDCGRVLNAEISQTNGASVSASASVSGGSVPWASGSAAAVGNAATFGVTRPTVCTGC